MITGRRVLAPASLLLICGFIFILQKVDKLENRSLKFEEKYQSVQQFQVSLSTTLELIKYIILFFETSKILFNII